MGYSHKIILHMSQMFDILKPFTYQTESLLINHSLTAEKTKRSIFIVLIIRSMTLYTDDIST